MILNVPLSMLLIAIAGAMVGFFILPAKDAARITPSPSAHGWHRVRYIVYSLALIGAVVIGYALVSAWIVQFGAAVFRAVFPNLRIEDAAMMPLAGLVGVGIRPWLPILLKAVERRADRVIGGSE